MAANIEKLVSCLSEMKAVYLKNPTEAVRSQEFIFKLHNYCIEELETQ